MNRSLQAQGYLVLGMLLAVIGFLMTVFNRWKFWRSRWFSVGGMWGHRSVDEKTALFATRFWGVMTLALGVVFIMVSLKGRS